jgi:hypothetical protein
MIAPTASTTSDLTEGVDVDAVVALVRASPGVQDLYGGSPEVATYLPGRRVLGVRVTGPTVQIQVRALWGMALPRIGAGIQAAVAPLAGGRAVDVMIADIAGVPSAHQAAGHVAEGSGAP